MKWRSLGRSGFEELRGARATRSGPITVSWVPGATRARPVLAFAISKRVGNAVARNRLRRRLKEAARRFVSMPDGLYLIRTAPAAAAMDFASLRRHLQYAVDGLSRPPKDRPQGGHQSCQA
ncbi:MAG TPA: ribonuclease P protein component [Acidimicrobiales bacterium]|nr:ribonuclease P protein component [Acidimicrobiales bacterium]